MRSVKRRANAVLAAAAGLFGVALTLKVNYPHSALATAFLTITEASLAGGVADWFAVTALFRKPLGFPYHTALIPRNRERVISALVRAVEQEFLSKQAIKARIDQVHLLEKIISYSRSAPLRSLARPLIEKAVVGLVESLDPNTIGKLGERVVKLIIKRQSFVPYAAAGIARVLEQGKGVEIYLAIIDKIAVLIERPETRAAIYRYLEDVKEKTADQNWLSSLITGFMELTDGINLEDAADALQQELINTVAELRQEEHPVQLWFQGELATIAVKLETPEWQEAIDDWKDDLIGRLELAQPMGVLADTVLTVCKQPTVYREQVVDWLTEQAASYWQQFKENQVLQSRAEDYLKMLILLVVEQEHALIGKIARRSLSKLSDEDLNQFIEDKAGEDLDWIRINGVIIGGLVGAGLALVMLL
ncbi:MAG: hypothetical protein H6Q72_497 [Firmicutes bacterium]|nr:hypothetical protein [Bacillota bacterium]